MKLCEIKYEFPHTTKSITGIIGNPDKFDLLGVGQQAIALAHKKHPNSVIKTIQLSGKNDIVLAFIRLCMTHKTNPFFPKIFAAKIYNQKYDYTDPFDEIQFNAEYDTKIPKHTLTKEQRKRPPALGKWVLVVVMEKLHSIDTAENKEQTFEVLKSLGLISKFITSVEDLGDESPSDQILDVMRKDWTRAELRKKSNNPKFKEALRLLEPLFKRSWVDLQTRNLMFRYTSVGPQLVLMDPVID